MLASHDSIHWLASDDGPKRSSPPRALPPPPPPPSSSSSSSLRESPTSCFHSQRKTRRRRRSDPSDGGRCGVDAVGSASQRHAGEKRRGAEETAPDSDEERVSQKRAELQRYVRPLSSILRGLKSGRYSERLSSFQESVAMDRIQRLVGLVQNPHMSGRLLGIVLTIEAMLQSWFPHIRPDPTQTDRGAPAKKQKLHGGAASSPPPSSAASLCSSRRLHPAPVCVPKTPGEVTQDSAVSSSTDSRSPPPRRLGFKIRSPCLERLLRAKESVVAHRSEREERAVS